MQKDVDEIKAFTIKKKESNPAVKVVTYRQLSSRLEESCNLILPLSSKDDFLTLEKNLTDNLDLKKDIEIYLSDVVIVKKSFVTDIKKQRVAG